jgi:hypothetical protein
MRFQRERWAFSDNCGVRPITAGSDPRISNMIRKIGPENEFGSSLNMMLFKLKTSPERVLDDADIAY